MDEYLLIVLDCVKCQNVTIKKEQGSKFYIKNTPSVSK